MTVGVGVVATVHVQREEGELLPYVKALGPFGGGFVVGSVVSAHDAVGACIAHARARDACEGRDVAAALAACADLAVVDGGCDDAALDTREEADRCARDAGACVDYAVRGGSCRRRARRRPARDRRSGERRAVDDVALRCADRRRHRARLPSASTGGRGAHAGRMPAIRRANVRP